ncbi:RNA-directed DNA polymerase, eukaryota [Tanacetum coccineum]
MPSPNKHTSNPSRVANMNVKPIWRKKPNICNTSNVLNSTSPIPKPLTPHHEPSQENNHPNQTLPNPHIKDTSTSPLDVSHPLLPISPINPHETHTQFPPQSDNHTQHNQTQHTSSLSPSRESLVDDINQLQDLSNLLAMHLSQQQNNIPSSPYSPNLPHTLNIDQVETHSGRNLNSNLCVPTGANSWFQTLQEVAQDFVSEERIAWIDIEGVPLHAWSFETFFRIGKKWGEMLNIEDTSVASFGRKRVYILTKNPVSILESFKIIVKGKVFMIRAKELFTWSPTFSVNKESICTSDDESVQSEMHILKQSYLSEEEEGEFKSNDVEGVAKTIFGENSASAKCFSEEPVKQNSEDPFKIYDLLKKNKSRVEPQVLSPSLSHPPGFSPVGHEAKSDKAHDFGEAIEVPGIDPSPQIDAEVLNAPQMVRMEVPNGSVGQSVESKGGSVLGVLEEVIRVGQAMGFSMEGLGSKTKKEWIKELCNNHKLSFIAIQETKMEKMSHMDVKFMWGNSNYDFVYSDSLGNSGGILCIWESSIFKKDYATISDNFVAVYGTWIPCNVKVLLISIYAPQQPAHKRDLWVYMSTLLGRWSGEVIIMGDFNEVRFKEERRGSGFNQSGARVFNQFITSSGIVDVKLEGFSFTWSHPSATKMSKLDRFLISDGIISLFPSITALCLDRHLSDHRSILLRDIQLDFGPTPFWFYHSWFSYDGFDEMVEQNWRSFSHSDTNGIIRFKKKLQELKSIIRIWIKDKRATLSNLKHAIEIELHDIDKELDSGYVSDTYLARRLELKGQLHEIKDKEAADFVQKSKVGWAIEGDENSRFFHGIINKKRSQLAIRGILVDGSWQTEPQVVKEAFLNHFEARFKKPIFVGPKINYPFPNRLSHDQVLDLEREVSRDEIRSAVWNCGDNKSPGPDGYTFEFFKKYWGFIGIDFCEAVEHFFNNGAFVKGIGCKRKIRKAMFFKVDFAKAYDSVRWDYLINVLEAFGFGMTWCQWIRGLCCFGKASVLVNGSPSREFQFQCGLKQGDPLAPLLFILVMESLHLSFSRVVEARIFKGIRLNNSISLSHLFYADDALIVGEWSSDNLWGIINVLKCFFLASGLQINIHKSQLLGVGVSRLDIEAAAASIGCSIMDNQFCYLGVMVGGNTSRHKFWADVVSKLRSRLSKWKTKTLSIGGRLTLLKSVLGASPLYYTADKKITWVAWDKVLASKKNGGLGVSSYFALNRALLLKWIWRFVSQDDSLLFQVMQDDIWANIDSHSVHLASNWCSILREMQTLKDKGFDFLSLCSKRLEPTQMGKVRSNQNQYFLIESSAKDTSSSSIDYIPKSPTSSTSPSPNGYLNPSTSPPPRVSPPPPTQDNASMDITLTLSPNTPLDVQFDTPSPSPPIIAHPIPWNFLEAHALFPSDPSSIPQVQEKNTFII